MNVELIRTLYAYSRWANIRILDTAAELPPEALRQTLGASFPSVHETLVHTAGGQWVWLSRWQGSSPKAPLDPADYSGLDSVRAYWAQIERDTAVFVEQLDEAQLASTIHYHTMDGTPKAMVLWQLMLHQANHATQHRSEAAAMLTHLGHSPGSLDMVYYLLNAGAQA